MAERKSCPSVTTPIARMRRSFGCGSGKPISLPLDGSILLARRQPMAQPRRDNEHGGFFRSSRRGEWQAPHGCTGHRGSPHHHPDIDPTERPQSGRLPSAAGSRWLLSPRRRAFRAPCETRSGRTRSPRRTYSFSPRRGECCTRSLARKRCRRCGMTWGGSPISSDRHRTVTARFLYLTSSP